MSAVFQFQRAFEVADDTQNPILRTLLVRAMGSRDLALLLDDHDEGYLLRAAQLVMDTIFTAEKLDQGHAADNKSLNAFVNQAGAQLDESAHGYIASLPPKLRLEVSRALQLSWKMVHLRPGQDVSLEMISPAVLAVLFALAYEDEELFHGFFRGQAPTPMFDDHASSEDMSEREHGRTNPASWFVGQRVVVATARLFELQENRPLYRASVFRGICAAATRNYVVLVPDARPDSVDRPVLVGTMHIVTMEREQ